MRLRHKQPLNPYKGQTNNDKNEFNDDDFHQQGSSLKNNTVPNTDQLIKYAKILTKFIKTVNQDALEFQDRNRHTQPPIPPPPHSQRPDSEIQRLRDLTFHKKEQTKDQKQQNQIQQKIEPKKQLKQIKSTPKKKETTLNTEIYRQNKNIAQQNPSAEVASIKQTTTQKPVQNYQKNNLLNLTNKIQLAKLNGINSVPANVTTQNLPPATSLEANIRLNYQNNMATLLSMQGLVPGIMANPNMLNLNGLNQIELAQLLIRFNPQNYMYGSLPNMTDIPLGMNMGVMGANGQPLMFRPPIILPAKPIQNLFSEQLKTFTLPVVDSEASNIKKAYPLKRSAFHVAIAYKIYLDKLKKEGENFQNLQEIDPTRNARRIKSNQQTNKNNKDTIKKKK